MRRATTATPAEAGGNGCAATPLRTLETTIDLEGNAGPERLAVDDRKLVVSDGRARAPCTHGRRREWWLHDVDGFRLEPALGSCFLQAHVAGEWIDLIRCPGGGDRHWTDSVDRLNAHCRRRRARTNAAGHRRRTSRGHHVPMVGRSVPAGHNVLMVDGPRACCWPCSALSKAACCCCWRCPWAR